MSTPSPEVQKVRAEQRRQIRGAAQAGAGCLALVLLAAIVVGGPPRLIQALSTIPSGDAIVFVRFPGLTRETSGAGPFVVVAFFCGLAAIRRTWAFALVGALTLAGLASSVYVSLYRPFTAVQFDRETFVLYFLWPRPPVRLPRTTVRRASVDEQASNTDNWTTDYRLRIDTDRASYVSMWIGHHEPAAAGVRNLGRPAARP